MLNLLNYEIFTIHRNTFRYLNMMNYDQFRNTLNSSYLVRQHEILTINNYNMLRLQINFTKGQCSIILNNYVKNNVLNYFRKIKNNFLMNM